MNDPMTHFDWLPGNSQILDVEGVRLETICFGPPPEQAATLILLHEGLGCVALWRAFPEALAEATGLGVFAYSRAGYGQSDPCSLPRPLDYMEREARDSLPRVLDAIGFRQGLLLGHSDGASIAALHGGFGDDLRVRGLVLMAPHFFTEPEGLAAIADARSQYQSGELRNRLGKYHADVDCAFLGWNDAWLDPGFRDWNITDTIDHLRIPVLAIQGRQDAYGTLKQIEEIDSRIYSPLETLIVDGCGHAPHLEQASVTLKAIVGFVDRLLRLEAEEVVMP